MTGLRERQKDARRRKILETASGLFRRQGYAETTIEQIAAGADLSPATVFNYFPGKGDLLLTMVAQADERYLSRLSSDLADRGLPAGEAITELLVTIARASLEVLPRDAWRHVLATSLQTREERFTRAYETLNARLLSAMVSLIEALQDGEKLARNIDSAAAARLLFDLDETLFARLVRDDERTLEDYRRETQAHVTLVLTGIGRAVSNERVSDSNRSRSS